MRIQSGVTEVHRGRRATSFTAELMGRGRVMVITPSKAILNQAEAQRLTELLTRSRIEKGQIFQVDQETRLELKQITPHSMVFRGARPEPADTKTYVLPENPGQIGGRREYYYDAIAVCRESATLVKKIEISDEVAAGFVAQKIKAADPSDRASYHLIYHNYRDRDTGEIKLRADGLVLIYRKRKLFSPDETAYVLVHKWKGSILTELPLEMVLKDHPARVVASSREVKLSRELYGEVYKKGELKARDLPVNRLKKVWPFALPKGDLIELRDPTLSIREKWHLYREAIRKDAIFGLATIGSVLHNAGRGLLRGAVLYSIWNLAQNTLRVATLLGILADISVLFYLVSNSRAAAEVQRIEATERQGDKLNAQYPLWEMGQRFKTLTMLIKRYLRISFSHLGAQLLCFTLFPPIFGAIFGLGGSILTAGIFVAGYLLSDILTVKTNAYDARNFFKLTESRLRGDKEFKKNYWTIDAFQDNLGMVANQVCYWGGLGISALIAFLLPAYIPAVGIAMGGASLILSAARFLLPLFGRSEKTRLSIEKIHKLRIGKTLEFSDNISLELGKDRKAEVIEQEDQQRIILPDFERSGIRIKVQNLKSVTLKRNWLSRILPFDFVRKHKIFIRTQDESDPILVYTVYGGEAPKIEEFVRNFLIVS